jgi:hypothetical protein
MSKYIAEIEHRVCGIPCLIGVTDYESYTPAYISGPPENCYPAEGGSGDYEILDQRGRPAPWLERKMKPRDHDDVQDRIFSYMEDC